MVIAGGTPSIGAVLKTDNHITFVDLTNMGHWVPGDPIVYDSHLNGRYFSPDFVISGASVTTNATLKTDPSLVFDPIHGKYFWDDGYIWDFGDGQVPVTGNVTEHVFVLVP